MSADRQMCERLVKRWEILDFYPREQPAFEALVQHFSEHAINDEHAQRVTLVVESDWTRCPRVVDLIQLLAETASDFRVRLPGCSNCHSTGWEDLEVRRNGIPYSVVRRCQCPLGLAIQLARSA